MAKGAISIEGAEKVVSEFFQSDKSVSHYIFIDSGRKRNKIKIAATLGAVLSIAVIFLFGKIPLIFVAFSIALLFSLSVIFLTIGKILANARESFQKEKVFLTEKNIIVQHALRERRINYVPIERYKALKRKRMPFFGEFATLAYLDGEGLSELYEPLYFPERIGDLESELRRLFEKSERDKKKPG